MLSSSAIAGETTRSRVPEGASVALDPGRAAWLAVLPTAVIVLLAMLGLGRPLGALLFPTLRLHYWTEIQQFVRPEPTEQARFLIALTAPLIHLALTTLLLRRPPRIAVGQVAARAVEASLLLAAVGGFVAQWTYHFAFPPGHPPFTVVYFTIPTLLVAVGVAAATVVGIRFARVRTRWATWTRESRGRMLGASLVAVLALALTLLPSVYTDGSIAGANEAFSYHLQFTYDETMAVLDGRSPIGDFAGQYASLWPYALAAGMWLAGNSSLGVFTTLMALLTGAALFCLFAVLRRVTRSSIAALLLFLPLLATSAYRLHGPVVDRFSLVNYFGTMPLRFAGPFLLAWLTARHLDGARPRRAWPLFLAGGLVVLNNTDFGFAAVGATVAALLWTRGRAAAPGLRRLGAEAGIGLGAAIALVIALLLVRTGALPDFSLLFRYARVFAVGGFAMVPIRPVVGLSTVIFLTYVAAIGVASVRALRGDPGRPLTGMLAWSGVFGLGEASYYIGHSLPEVLIYTFPCWAFALALLTVVVVQALAGRAGRRPGPSELACLFGFGVLVCSLAQTPAPWSELDRLGRHGPSQFVEPVGQAFVAEHTRPGEPVAILMTLGHRISANVGTDDVEPYTGARSIQTVEQLDDTTRALREAGGTKLFVWPRETLGVLAGLPRDYRPGTQEPGSGVQMWVLRR